MMLLTLFRSSRVHVPTLSRTALNYECKVARAHAKVARAHARVCRGLATPLAVCVSNKCTQECNHEPIRSTPAFGHTVHFQTLFRLSEGLIPRLVRCLVHYNSHLVHMFMLVSTLLYGWQRMRH